VSPADRLISVDVSAILGANNFDFTGKRVLVTGGAGFLGSWISEALVSARADVVCIDNLATQASTQHIGRLMKLRNFHFRKEDITKWKPSGDYDVIIHAASIPSPDQYTKEPVATMLANSVAIHKLLDFAAKKNLVFLYASTSEIYGDASVIPTPETFVGAISTTGPRACYCESKRYGETACIGYKTQYGIDVRIARIFNTYGPRLDGLSSYSRVISRFIAQALENKDITVHGDGNQTRSFSYVTDTVTALLRFVDKRKLGGVVLNIGNPEEVTITQLAKIIRKMVASRSRITYAAARPDDPFRRCPEITQAQRILKWRPKVSLDEGLHRTIKWFEASRE
jgi:UDP-glucuronate decarboxylase